LNTDAGAFADVFVMGALVSVLKSAPPTDVVDEDSRKISLSVLDVLDQLLQRIATVQAKPTFPFVGVRPNNLQPRRAAYCLIASPWFSVEYF